MTDYKTDKDVTIKEMEDLCNKGFELQKECDAIEDGLKDKKESLRLIQSQVMAYMEHFNLKKWTGSNGNIEIRERSSVKTPKTDEEKKLLFEWLEQKGIYWAMVGVNSQSLNSMYNEELEIAKANNTELVIPGIGERTIYKQTILKPKKG